VTYEPKEAETPEGAAALYARLRRAAAWVCEEPAGMSPASLSAMAPYASCVKAALGSAVREVKVPLVAALHLEGMRHREPALASR
jgi:UrcA family protein